jgi:hypothetical protein
VLIIGSLCLPVCSYASWKTIAPGLEIGVFPTKTTSIVGDSKITILRIDPDIWKLSFYCIDSLDLSEGLTAGEWCRGYGLVAAINAGMFATDYKTHIGYLREGEYVNNGRTNKYRSVVAANPVRNDPPRFRIFDLDDPETDFNEIDSLYSSVAQNLRLIKRPGENRWSQQDRMWSEAAVGEDTEGRVLMIICRSPFSMHDLNRELLSLDIGLVCAQHLEGGPEAQLYVHTEEFELEIFGSYETDFIEDDSNDHAWPVPNVIGVSMRKK